MDYSKKIKSLRGEELPKNFPSQKEIDSLPKKENPQDPKGPKIPDIDRLEKETVGNIILNCLIAYRCENRKEGFYVNMIAEHVIKNDKKSELKDKLNTFLIEVLEDSIMRIEKIKDSKEQKGIYAGWILSQVFSEMGVEESI